MAALRQVLCALIWVLASIPPTTLAATYSANVRWQPSSDPTVAGYRVYQRTASGSYGAPQQAGMPTPAADGTMSVVASSLDVRTDYVFAVTDYMGSGTESGLSNEMPIGYAQVAPLMDSDGDGLTDAMEDVNLNRIVDPGETDPNNPDTDGDGVRDGQDKCQGTAPGPAVNASGCSCAQITCNNGNACDGVETCTAGVCHAGTPLNCDDGNACTTDTCNASTGCAHTAIAGCAACTTASQCNDGNPCTTDTCTAGHCQSTAVANGTSCSDGNVCNGAETCQGGACTAGTALNCNDGNVCTSDGCSSSAGCTHSAILGCTACTTAGQCDDGNACTVDTCSAGTCQHAAAPNGTACGDGNFCNGAETCQAGSCAAGTPVNCDDGNACTTDGCDPILGQCTHLSLPGCCTANADCVDLDACTINERCEAGACVSDSLVCGAPGPCTQTVCDPHVGCTTHPLPDGTACSDGDPCTQSAVCTGGVCGVAAAAVAGTGADAATSIDLEVSEFFLRRVSPRSWRLVANGSFAAPLGLDLTANAFTIALLDADGVSLYEATVEGSDFTRTGDHYLYKANPISDNGLKKVELWTVGEVAQVSITAKVPVSVAGAAATPLVVQANSLNTDGSRITWVLTIGDQCVRKNNLNCPPNSSRKRCN
jgi:hypothetical protein